MLLHKYIPLYSCSAVLYQGLYPNLDSILKLKQSEQVDEALMFRLIIPVQNFMLTKKMKTIDFQVQRAQLNVFIIKYWNTLVDMIENKPLSVYWSDLAHSLPIDKKMHLNIKRF